MRTLKFTVLLLSVISCKKDYVDHPNYEISGVQYGYDDLGEYHLFGLKFQLTAKQDSLPPFYLMTCDWGSRNATTNNDNFFLGDICDVNFLAQEQLKIGECMELRSTVSVSKLSFRDVSNKLRVALIIIDTVQLNYMDSIGRRRQFNEEVDSLNTLQSNYVWSNEITLAITDTKIKRLPGHWFCE